MTDTKYTDIYEEGDFITEANQVDTDEKTPAESLPDKKSTSESEETEEKDEENLPFHKHPRWKKVQEEKERLASEVEELKAWKEKVNNDIVREEQTATVPNWWKEQYGDDETSLSNYKQYLSNNEKFEEKVIAKAVERIKSEQQAGVEAQQKAEEYFESQFTELEDEGKQFDRNELKKFMVDFEKKHGLPIVYTEGKNKGYYNFKAAYDLMSELKTDTKASTTQRKKEIASGSMVTKPSSQSDGIPVFNRTDFRDGSWRDIIKQ